MNLTGENGNGTVHLVGAAPTATYEIRFCLFPLNSGPKGNENCGEGGAQFTTDASGNATADFAFGQSGTWNGFFTIVPGGASATTIYDGSFDMPAQGTEFQSALKRSSQVSSRFSSSPGNGHPGTDQLTGGYVAVRNTTVHFSLNGAAADATYTAHYCGEQPSSNCYVLGTVTTDANGNASQDFDYSHTAGTYNAAGIFFLSRNVQGSDDSEFTSAFTVP